MHVLSVKSPQFCLSPNVVIKVWCIFFIEISHKFDPSDDVIVGSGKGLAPNWW